MAPPPRHILVEPSHGRRTLKKTLPNSCEKKGTKEKHYLQSWKGHMSPMWVQNQLSRLPAQVDVGGIGALQGGQLNGHGNTLPLPLFQFWYALQGVFVQ